MLWSGCVGGLRNGLPTRGEGVLPFCSTYAFSSTYLHTYIRLLLPTYIPSSLTTYQPTFLVCISNEGTSLVYSSVCQLGFHFQTGFCDTDTVRSRIMQQWKTLSDIVVLLPKTFVQLFMRARWCLVLWCWWWFWCWQDERPAQNWFWPNPALDLTMHCTQHCPPRPTSTHPEQ